MTTTLLLLGLGLGFNPLAWPLHVLLLAGAGIAAPMAYLAPGGRLRLALAAVAIAAASGGIFHAKGAADCAARHALAELADKVRLLERKASIDAQVRAADAAREKLNAGVLRDFDSTSSKVLHHVDSSKAAAACGLSPDSAGRVRDIFKAGARDR